MQMADCYTMIDVLMYMLLCLCLKTHQQLSRYGDMETGTRLKVSSDRLLKPGIVPATPDLQGK